MSLSLLLALQIAVPQHIDGPLRPAKLHVWGFSDPHIDSDLKNGFESLSTALADSQRFPWDIGICTGDYFNLCPDEEAGRALVAQYGSVDPNRIYGVIGNHDSGGRPGGAGSSNSGGSNDASIFRRFVDPLGENTDESGIANERRPYPVTGEWDSYSFQAGNVLFLMLGDHNFGSGPFGRKCHEGYPAGRYTSESYDWWVEQVEANRDKIVVTCAHHTLQDTTAYSGLFEGFASGVHKATNWADRTGSSFLYAIDDVSVDGFDRFENPAPIPPNFRDYIRENPGCIDMWLSGHSHARMYPGKVHNDRSDVEVVDGVLFMNLGSISRYQAPPEVTFSRVMQFTAHSNLLLVHTFLHEPWNGRGPGFYPEAFFHFVLRHPFDPR